MVVTRLTGHDNESQRWFDMRSISSPEACCLLQVVNAPGGCGKTSALATLLAEQEEIRSRSASASWCPSLAARHERHQDDVNKHGKRSHFTMTTLVRNLARCC